MNLIFQDEVNNEIKQAFIDHFNKYNITNLKEQVEIIRKVLKGNFTYITKDNRARIKLERYGPDAIRRCILESEISRLAKLKDSNQIEKVLNGSIPLNKAEKIIMSHLITPPEKKENFSNLITSLLYYIDLDEYVENFAKHINQHQKSDPSISKFYEMIDETYKDYIQKHKTPLTIADMQDISKINISAMPKELVKECLKNKEIIQKLLTQKTVQKGRTPDIIRILDIAEEYQIEESYYELFANGYVASILESEYETIKSDSTQAEFFDKKVTLIDENLKPLKQTSEFFTNNPFVASWLAHTKDISNIILSCDKDTLSKLESTVEEKMKSFVQRKTELRQKSIELEKQLKDKKITNEEYLNEIHKINEESTEITKFMSQLTQNKEKITERQTTLEKETKTVSQDKRLQQALANAFQAVQNSKKSPETTSNLVTKPISQNTKDEYSKAKIAYEAVSESATLDQHIEKTKKEIDIDLEEFAKEERKILNSKHLKEEQKQSLIADLYKEFDEYVEKNPETKKSK